MNTAPARWINVTGPDTPRGCTDWLHPPSGRVFREWGGHPAPDAEAPPLPEPAPGRLADGRWLGLALLALGLGVVAGIGWTLVEWLA